jgi:hypothetical protein
MSENEGRNRLKELAQGARAKVQDNGRLELDRKGTELLEQIVVDLTGPEGMPGLYAQRDVALRVRLRRQGKAGQIVAEWDRTIGAMLMVYERFGARPRHVRYLLNEEEGAWRAMEGKTELYEDLTAALVEILYPENRR